MMSTQRADENAVTAELPTEPAVDPFLQDAGAAMAVDIAAASHAGLVRQNNEDHYLVIRFRRSLENLQTNLSASVLARTYDLSGYGLLVADGLGGMAAGEVASSAALAKLVELVVDTPDWILGLQEKENAETVLQRMKDRFFLIDESLKEQAQRDETLRGMGTTLTVAGILNKDLVIGHVGDSRAYLLRDGSLKQLTTDHTLAQALIDAGIVKREEPASRSMRHVLTAALGSSGARTQPEVRRLRLDLNDQLLLCTDGLTEMVDDKAIASLMRNAPTAQKACEDLITVTLAAGGLDNVTVAVARFQ
jgi:protein phosphatase